MALNSIFDMSTGDLKKLENFMRNAPVQFRQSTAGVLTSLAAKTRELDIQNINSGMIVRNKKFVESSLRFDRAKSGPIESQVAYAYSLNRKNFTGWKEQQDGTPSAKNRAGTINARNGSKRNVMSQQSRFKSKNKFYNMSSFRASTKNDKSAFAFMIRYLASMRGGLFLLPGNISTKSGTLGRGLYQFKNHKIKRLQKLGGLKQPAAFRWRTYSLNMLRTQNDIASIWSKEINKVINKAGLK